MRLVKQVVPPAAVLTVVFMCIGVFPPAARSVSGQASDPRATEIVDRMLVALGGLDTFHNTRYIAFTFIRGEQPPIGIWWDKWSGRARVEAVRDGTPWVGLVDVNSKDGRAFVDGAPAEGEDAERLVEMALRMWAGEIYWFLAPYKLKDRGIILQYDGEETIDGATYDRVHASFEQVGFTPGDQFWHYVNRDTHLLDRWRFALQSGGKGEFWWRDWQPYGSLMLSPIREAVDGSVTIRMEDIVVTDAMPDAVFESPEPVARAR